MNTRLDVLMRRPETTERDWAKTASPLERLLADRRRMETIRQKWNMKDMKHQKIPTQQWEGDDRS